jgi:large subunit ribosomal protein L21
MYAIFETGGKQYKVLPGDVIRIEKLAGDAGDAVSFENVIAYSDGESLRTGTPYLDAAVNATVTGNGKGEKVIIFKFKSKKDYRKKQGHRQPYTEIEIESFTIDGKTVGERPKKAEPEDAADIAAEAEADTQAEAIETADTEAEAVETAEAPAAESAADEDVQDEADAEEETGETRDDTAEAAGEDETDTEEAADTVAGTAEKAASSLKKADITAKLDELGVEYLKKATKDELLALLAEAEQAKA